MDEFFTCNHVNAVFVGKNPQLEGEQCKRKRRPKSAQKCELGDQS